MNTNDFEILNRLKQRDSAAFKELFDLYYLPLSTHALKYCDSFAMAEDIVQDLFVKIWDDKLYMKFDEYIGPYLFKAVKNNALQAIKAKAKYRFEDIENQVDNLLAEDKLDKEFVEQEKNKLYQKIESLPRKSKEVFMSIVLENLKYKEVALKYDISVNTVKTHYSRALKQLRSGIEIIILLFFI
ncbi:RNA polymerase sigma-70 factor, ECF subfamily [Flaviramulus basaltis]|uniref:RNA polymerase sigma-70 factor, ECF subfamily n=1 Tax=Flaviramulus basaltis TaxID=369401 RepID=A0A1K2IB16_9FLAO|nr:sigma-70 family RNA polymerase sigma factor [Flaviramulus basaltis]SFZ89466.1 RNA polymerase sigma-70 factor, ECF subfamily [Flaviramulus basaltis]